MSRTGQKRIFAGLALLVCLLLGGALAQPLRVMTHESFDLSRDVVDSFTEETGIEVEFLPAGDAGEVVSRAILTAGRPIADVLFGVDNNLMVRAFEAQIFEPYRSPLLDEVPEQFHLDPEYRVTPIDVGYVNFNVDLGWFAENDLEPPATLEDLLAEEYRGLTIVLDPATSSPGLAFMLTTIDRFGEEGWLQYWQELTANDVLVQGGWSDAYYTTFSRYGGSRPIVLSYATSPAAEVMFAEEELASAPTGNLLCEGCAYQQVEAAGILRGSSQVEEAQAFIDFLLSLEVQEDIPAVMFVYPVRADAELPYEFEEFAREPTQTETASLPGEEVEANLDRWLDQWTQVVTQGRDPGDVR